MKKTRVLILAALLLAAGAQAQREEEPKRGFQKEKLFIGGNFGLAFGDYTFINVSPQVGYRFTDVFAAGMGINAQYVNIKDWDAYGAYRQRETILGLNVFGRVYPIKNIMLQAQPELNYRFGKLIYAGPPKRTTNSDAVIVPSLLLGGGAVLPSGRGALILSVFYDVLQKEYSPYGRQPIYNFGYNIGF